MQYHLYVFVSYIHTVSDMTNNDGGVCTTSSCISYWGIRVSHNCGSRSRTLFHTHIIVTHETAETSSAYIIFFLLHLSLSISLSLISFFFLFVWSCGGWCVCFVSLSYFIIAAQKNPKSHKHFSFFEERGRGRERDLENKYIFKSTHTHTNTTNETIGLQSFN